SGSISSCIARSIILLTLHLFVLLTGLVSIMSTLSPTLHVSFSSWALNLVFLFTAFLYLVSIFICMTSTTTVLFILSLTTVPTLDLYFPLGIKLTSPCGEFLFPFDRQEAGELSFKRP